MKPDRKEHSHMDNNVSDKKYPKCLGHYGVTKYRNCYNINDESGTSVPFSVTTMVLLPQNTGFTCPFNISGI